MKIVALSLEYWLLALVSDICKARPWNIATTTRGAIYSKWIETAKNSIVNS